MTRVSEGSSPVGREPADSVDDEEVSFSGVPTTTTEWVTTRAEASEGEEVVGAAEAAGVGSSQIVACAPTVWTIIVTLSGLKFPTIWPRAFRTWSSASKVCPSNVPRKSSGGG